MNRYGYFSWHKIIIWSSKISNHLNFNHFLSIRKLAEGLQILFFRPWVIRRFKKLTYFEMVYLLHYQQTTLKNIKIYIFWWDMSSTTTVLILLSYNASINFFIVTIFVFFFHIIFYLSTRFLCLLAIESAALFHFVSEFTVFVSHGHTRFE